MTTSKLRFVETESARGAQSAEALRESKKRLRAYMKARRGENENRDVKEDLLTGNLLAALAGKSGGTGVKRAFVYLSFSSEAPTDKLIARLIEEGWQVYCPRIEDKSMVAALYGEDFALSAYGIREPLGERYDGEMDVAIVPVLAADTRGGRLGYGGGYYDKYLSAHPETLRIAYGFDFQIVRQVPTEEHDVMMDVIVTDKRIVRTNARQRETFE